MVRMIRAGAFWLSMFLIVGNVYGVEKTFQWPYNRYFYDNDVTGFYLYRGNTADTVTEKIADIKKADITIANETAIILEEHFDTDPGTKYTVEGEGSWSWVENTENMKVVTGEGKSFMVVLTYPAGTANDFYFKAWPEKKYGTDGLIYSYLKDDGAYGTSYLELRLASGDTRFSNFRKVVNSQFGGVEGAFSLPKFAECALKSEGETICPGWLTSISWDGPGYESSWNGVAVGGSASESLNIQRLEIIFTNQDGWLDDLIIGGRMTLQKKVSFTEDNPEIFFAISAYGPNGESGKSMPVRYLPESGQASGSKLPAMPGQLLILD